ncbi:MAG: helix-turn-helix transcriptional regulator [Pseudomonadota bacterium]
MNIPINHQIIAHNGMPVAVVIPYDEYIAKFSVDHDKNIDNDEAVPHEVASRVLKEQISPIRAWREHLNLTQAEVAQRMNVSQSAFAQMENVETTQRHSTLKKLAAALGISVEQIDW